MAFTPMPIGACPCGGRGKMQKAETQPSHPPIIEDGPTYVPSKGWVEMVS